MTSIFSRRSSSNLNQSFREKLTLLFSSRRHAPLTVAPNSLGRPPLTSTSLQHVPKALAEDRIKLYLSSCIPAASIDVENESTTTLGRAFEDAWRQDNNDTMTEFQDLLNDLRSQVMIKKYSDELNLGLGDVELMLRLIRLMRRNFQTHRWPDDETVKFAALAVREKRQAVLSLLKSADAHENKLGAAKLCRTHNQYDCHCKAPHIREDSDEDVKEGSSIDRVLTYLRSQIPRHAATPSIGRRPGTMMPLDSMRSEKNVATLSGR